MHRLLMVPALYIILLLAVFIPWFRSSGMSGPVLLSVFILLLLPWTIGVLSSVLKCANPAWAWAVSVLNILLCFTIFICYTKLIYISMDLLGIEVFRPTFVVIAINTLFLVCYSRSLARLGPRRCPSCKRRTLIPLLRFGKLDKRTANTRWCASCGAMFWRDRHRVWQVERRKTWLDEDEAGRDEVKRRVGAEYKQESEHVVPPPPADRGHEPLIPGVQSRPASSTRTQDGGEK
jgi:hypothetical protein